MDIRILRYVKSEQSSSGDDIEHVILDFTGRIIKFFCLCSMLFYFSLVIIFNIFILVRIPYTYNFIKKFVTKLFISLLNLIIIIKNIMNFNFQSLLTHSKNLIATLIENLISLI